MHQGGNSFLFMYTLQLRFCFKFQYWWFTYIDPVLYPYILRALISCTALNTLVESGNRFWVACGILILLMHVVISAVLENVLFAHP